MWEKFELNLIEVGYYRGGPVLWDICQDVLKMLMFHHCLSKHIFISVSISWGNWLFRMHSWTLPTVWRISTEEQARDSVQSLFSYSLSVFFFLCFLCHWFCGDGLGSVAQASPALTRQLRLALNWWHSSYSVPQTIGWWSWATMWN